MSDPDSEFARLADFKSLDVIPHIDVYLFVDSLNVVEKVNPLTGQMEVALPDEGASAGGYSCAWGIHVRRRFKRPFGWYFWHAV